MLLPSHERRLQRPERGRKASERVFSGLFSEEGKRSIIPGFEIRREEEEEKEARTSGRERPWEGERKVHGNGSKRLSPSSMERVERGTWFQGTLSFLSPCSIPCSIHQLVSYSPMLSRIFLERALKFLITFLRKPASHSY